MLQGAAAWHWKQGNSCSRCMNEDHVVVGCRTGLAERSLLPNQQRDTLVGQMLLAPCRRSAKSARTSAERLALGILTTACVSHGQSAWSSHRRQRQALRARLSAQRLVGVRAQTPGQSVSLGSAADELDTLAVALEFAERTKQTEETARLRKRLSEAEAANPVAALLWRQQRQVRTALDDAMYRPNQSVNTRLQAVQSLRDLALPPVPVVEAEDALHRILKDIDGESAGMIRSKVESALWDCWHKSGNADVDDVLDRGIALMEKEQLKEAIDCFTDAISADPGFAEAWNKRATALYSLQEYDRSIEDCAKVLELKPRHFGCLSGLGMCHIGRGDEKEAFKWFRKALDVHPGMVGAHKFVLNAIVQDRLGPMVSDVVNAMSQGANLVAETGNGLMCTWDVHRVVPDDDGSRGCIYFFRIGVRNEGAAAQPLQSLARFYVLRFKTGDVFPFMRLTEGDASFSLKPGEEYKYCWALIVSKDLHGMAGGVLMERKGEEADEQSDEERYPRCSMQPLLSPHLSPEVPMGKLEVLGDGYYFTGQLDLRRESGA